MKFIKIALVVVVAGLVTALGIDATDTLRGSDGTLLSQLASAVPEAGCPSGTKKIEGLPGDVCIDSYEVSAGKGCAHTQISSALGTEENMRSGSCVPQSVAGVLPWTYVTYHQAQELCARRGMRLPTNDEWYMAAVGTPDLDVEGGASGCNLDSGVLRDTGVGERCVSPGGHFDMFGNAWEWVNAEVQDGMYNNRKLPPQGYVSDADVAGVALSTSEEEVSSFHQDYFWSSGEGSFGMIRGGFYSSDSDGGLYSVQAQVARSFTGVAIGFRCVKTL